MKGVQGKDRVENTAQQCKIKEKKVRSGTFLILYAFQVVNIGFALPGLKTCK